MKISKLFYVCCFLLLSILVACADGATPSASPTPVFFSMSEVTPQAGNSGSGFKFSTNGGGRSPDAACTPSQFPKEIFPGSIKFDQVRWEEFSGYLAIELHSLSGNGVSLWEIVQEGDDLKIINTPFVGPQNVFAVPRDNNPIVIPVAAEDVDSFIISGPIMFIWCDGDRIFVNTQYANMRSYEVAPNTTPEEWFDA